MRAPTTISNPNPNPNPVTMTTAKPKAKAKRGNHRRYCDADKAGALLALASNGGNIKRTAKETGIPYMTLSEWSKGGCHESITKFRDENRDNLADAMETMAWRLLEAMPGKIGDASLRDVATALGISIDKARLLRNEATSISVNVEGMSDDDRIKQLARLAERIRSRRFGAVDAGRAPAIGHDLGGDDPAAKNELGHHPTVDPAVGS